MSLIIPDHIIKKADEVLQKIFSKHENIITETECERLSI